MKNQKSYKKNKNSHTLKKRETTALASTAKGATERPIEWLGAVARLRMVFVPTLIYKEPSAFLISVPYIRTDGQYNDCFI